jgi:DNA-binding GntR family transcriptional regulator
MNESFKLTREPLYERAYKAVLQMILGGTLKAGQRVTEVYLAELLTVSPTPVREAMRKLEHEGLLQSSGNTVRITKLSQRDVEQLYSCRMALEVLGLRLAIKNLTKEDLQRLDRILNEAEHAAAKNDFVHVVRKNTAFHEGLIEASQNNWLMSVVGFVRRPLGLVRMQITFNQREVTRILRDHRTILKWIEKRDVRRATLAMRKHMLADCKYMIRELKEASQRSPEFGDDTPLPPPVLTETES